MACARELGRGSYSLQSHAAFGQQPRVPLIGLDLARPGDLAPLSQSADMPLAERVAIMISAQFGEVLLIDQREIAP